MSTFTPSIIECHIEETKKSKLFIHYNVSKILTADAALSVAIAIGVPFKGIRELPPKIKLFPI
jgi:hypothetical protein|uniref:Uncharacterized protein n=1 Tax=viral metagenome TaxID=1070528 RepID=A0A6C0IW41_9ZZZZ